MSDYAASQRSAKMSILTTLFHWMTGPVALGQYRLRVIQAYFELLKDVK